MVSKTVFWAAAYRHLTRLGYIKYWRLCEFSLKGLEWLTIISGLIPENDDLYSRKNGYACFGVSVNNVISRSIDIFVYVFSMRKSAAEHSCDIESKDSVALMTTEFLYAFLKA